MIRPTVLSLLLAIATPVIVLIAPLAVLATPTVPTQQQQQELKKGMTEAEVKRLAGFAKEQNWRLSQDGKVLILAYPVPGNSQKALLLTFQNGKLVRWSQGSKLNKAG